MNWHNALSCLIVFVLNAILWNLVFVTYQPPPPIPFLGGVLVGGVTLSLALLRFPIHHDA